MEIEIQKGGKKMGNVDVGDVAYWAKGLLSDKELHERAQKKSNQKKGEGKHG